MVDGAGEDELEEEAGEDGAGGAGEGGHALEVAEDFALVAAGGVAGDEGLEGGVEDR